MRILWVLAIQPDPLRPIVTGGDGPFYIEVAQSFANGTGLSTCHSSDCSDDPARRAPITTVGPLYPAFLSIFFAIWPDMATALQASRIADAFVITLAILAVYWIALQVAGRRAGLVAAAVMAIDLRFIVEIGNAHTEPLTTLLLLAGVAATLWALDGDANCRWLLAGFMLGLASLARPVMLVAPLVISALLALTRPRAPIARAWLWLPTLCAITIAPWLVRNYVVLGTLTFAEGGAAHFWLGAQSAGRWEGQQSYVDSIENLPQEPEGNPTSSTYLRDTIKTITAAPRRYVALLLAKLGRAYAQPIGTVILGGESIKDATVAWLNGERSLSDVIRIRQFVPKLYIYVFHYTTIGLALIALAICRRRWKEWLLPALVIVSISGAYTLLTIIPRYLFPIMPLYIVLAAMLIPRRGGNAV
ncbi:MAG: ArnT family glycosyltransferase [Anaerolineales bacterium]